MDIETLIEKIRFKGMLPEEKEIVIRSLRKDGWSINRIGLRLQTSPQLIWYWMKRLKIK